MVSMVFLCLILLPLIQQFTNVLPVKKLAGVEVQAEAPEFVISGWFNRDFQQGFETWFNTHAGLRPWMVRTANQINHTIFNEEPTGSGTRIHFGKDNFLFEEPYITAYNEPGGKKQQLLHDITWGLWRFQKLLEKNDIVLLLVLSPSKAEIYPEYLPNNMKKSGRDRRL